MGRSVAWPDPAYHAWPCSRHVLALSSAGADAAYDRPGGPGRMIRRSHSSPVRRRPGRRLAGGRPDAAGAVRFAAAADGSGAGCPGARRADRSVCARPAARCGSRAGRRRRRSRRPPPVQAQPLATLDLFSAGRDTGLGADLWKGSSAHIARTVIPGLADKPLSPAGDRPGPPGAGHRRHRARRRRDRRRPGRGAGPRPPGPGRCAGRRRHPRPHAGRGAAAPPCPGSPPRRR